MYLGVPKHVADCIEEDHKGDIKRQKEEAIDWWLNNIESASWQTLADALWKPDHCNLARTIESMMSEIPGWLQSMYHIYFRHMLLMMCLAT